jgi:hypothetical protein
LDQTWGDRASGFSSCSASQEYLIGKGGFEMRTQMFFMWTGDGAKKPTKIQITPAGPTYPKAGDGTYMPTLFY